MLGILHNFFRFIVKEGRWKETGIMPFYVFAFLTVGLRMGMIVGYNVSYSLRYSNVNGNIIRCSEVGVPSMVNCSLKKKSTDGYMYGNSCAVLLKSVVISFGFFYACQIIKMAYECRLEQPALFTLKSESVRKYEKTFSI